MIVFAALPLVAYAAVVAMLLMSVTVVTLMGTPRSVSMGGFELGAASALPGAVLWMTLAFLAGRMNRPRGR